MPALEKYIFAMESWTAGDASGSGLAVFTLEVAGTGTCGITTPQAGLPMPVPTLTATGSWRPLGDCLLPGLEPSAAQAGWRPAWGCPVLPAPGATGLASLPLIVDAVLTPLVYTAATGTRAALALPVPSPYGLSGCNRQGAAGCLLPAATGLAWSCSLSDPVRNETLSDDVVGLLCQGNADLAKAALALANGATLASAGADGLAGTLLTAVAANLAYAEDSDGDVWTCALGTYTRGSGDCEDGAILLHGLLLAAGLPADRLITTFGRVGIDRQGHAWLTYRRERDGAWIALDWTAGVPVNGVAGISPIGDVPYYALVDYALTAQSFFPVRQRTAQFFSSVAAVTLALPSPEIDAAGALGTSGVCALASNWLRGSGRVGSLGQGTFPGHGVTATARSCSLDLHLANPILQAVAGLSADAVLTGSSVCGLILGGWCAGRLRPTGPTITGSALQVGRNAASIPLGRVRLAASATGGCCGACRAGWPKLFLDATACPGGLAQLTALLPVPLETAGTDAATAGAGLETLPPWLATGNGIPTDALLANYHWQPATLEAW